MSVVAFQFPKLAENLRNLAEDYFNGEPIEHRSGICLALSAHPTSRVYGAFGAIEKLMRELGYKSAYFGPCSMMREKWEKRAYMCLLLAEYLEAPL